MHSRARILIQMLISFFVGILIGVYASRLSSPAVNKVIDKSANFTEKDEYEIKKVANQFLENRISRLDTLNYSIFSDSMLKINEASGFPGPVAYAKYIQSVYPLDFAEVIGIVLLNGDSARAFVKDYGKDTSIVIYNFIRQSSGWKFNGYVFSHDDW